MSYETANRGPETIAIQATFTVFAFIVVVLRLYVRFFMIRKPGAEDYVIIFSMLCAIALTTGYGVQVGLGMGKHISQVPPENVQPLLKWLYASIFFYCLNLGLTKISIVLQLIRVFGTAGYMTRVYWFSLAAMIVYTMYSVSAGVFTCWPVQFWWDPTIEGGTCKQKPFLWYTNNGLNIVTDLWIFFLPIPAVRSLQLPRKQKIGLIVVFAMGGVVAIISFLRIPALIETSNSTDLTWDNIKVGIFSSVEVNVGIICASLPALKALFPRLLAGSNRTYGSGQPSHGRNIDKFLERFGVESAASRAYPMDKLSGSKSSRDEDPNDRNEPGIKITTSVAQTIYKNKGDGLSLSESERNLVSQV